MKKIYLLFLFSCIISIIQAQTYGWSMGIGGPAADYGNAVAADDSGNVYVTGRFSGTVDFDPSAGNTATLASAGQTDIFIAKYNSAGSYKWAFRIGNVIADEGAAIAIDKSGNILVTGNFQGPADFDPSANTATLTPGAYNDIFIAKYTRNGQYLWAKDIYGSGYDYGYSISSGHSNKVYVSGRYSKTADFDPSANTANLNSNNMSADIFIACYDSSGNYVWAKSIGGRTGELSFSSKLDKEDNLFLCGYFADTINADPAGTYTLVSKGLNDVMVAQYDSLGAFKWAKAFGGMGDDFSTSIAVDQFNHLCVTGRFADTVDFDPGNGVDTMVAMAGSTDAFVSCFDQQGNHKWVNGIGNASFDQVFDVETGAEGALYVTGSFFGTIDFDPSAGSANLTSSGDDIYIVKYDSLGNYVWVKGIGNANQQTPSSIYLDAANNIYLTGYFYTSINFEGNQINAAGQSDLFVVKYSDPLATGVKRGATIHELRIYPNPCREVLNVELPKAFAGGSVKIYDAVGELVLSEKIGSSAGISLNVSALPSGLYMLECSGGGHIVTRKLVK